MNYRYIKHISAIVLIALCCGHMLCVPYHAYSAQDDTKERELFLVAQKAFDDGFYDVAIRYIEQYLEQYPYSEKRTSAKLLLGQCYFFKELYLDAFDVFHSLLESPEQKDATFFWLAETYHKGGDYKQALNYYQQVIDLYPSSVYIPQAYYSRAWTLFAQNDFKKAYEAFDVFLQRFPNHELAEDAHFKRAESTHNQARYEEAIQHFTRYLEQFPNSPRADQAYFYIAESYYYQDNYAHAIDAYRKAAEHSSDDSIKLLALIGVGWGYLKTSDFANAEEYFAQAQALATEKNTPSDDIYLGRASLFFEKKEYQQALTEYRTLIERFPSSSRIADAYLGAANSLYLLEKYREAIAEYTDLIKKFLKDAGYRTIIEKAYFGLAWTHLKAGNASEAIENFQYVADNTDNNIVKVSALTQIGDVYQDTQQLSKALERYDFILKNFPSSAYNDYVQYRQAIALLKMDKIEAATISFKSLQLNFPQSKYLTDVQYYLGLAYFKKNDWYSAQDHIARFIEVTPKIHTLQPEARYILGLSTYNLGKPQEAINIFERIIKNYPDRTSITRDAEMNIAKCFYSLGNDKEALKKFKIIAYKYPKTQTAFESLLWLGRYYTNNADYKNAITYYQQIVDDFPGSDDIDAVYFELGQAYQRSKQFDLALNNYKQITAASNRELFAKAKLAIADIFSADLDFNQAIEAYQNVAQTCPEFIRDAYVKIAQIYHNRRDYTQEITFYQKALDAKAGLSAFNNAELYFNIGDAYELANQPKEAIETYLKVPYLNEGKTRWAVKAYLRIARIFEDQEDWQNAQLVYNKIISYGTDEAKFARERIEWIATQMTNTNIGGN